MDGWTEGGAEGPGRPAGKWPRALWSPGAAAGPSADPVMALAAWARGRVRPAAGWGAPGPPSPTWTRPCPWGQRGLGSRMVPELRTAMRPLHSNSAEVVTRSAEQRCVLPAAGSLLGPLAGRQESEMIPAALIKSRRLGLRIPRAPA